MKNYIAPSISVEQINSAAILTGSIGVDTSTGTSTQFSRRHEEFLLDSEDEN